jgi:hypothetical protein
MNQEIKSTNKDGFVIQANPECGIRLDAALIAEPFRGEIRERVQALKEHGVGAFL